MACKVPVIAGNNSGATSWLLNYGKAGRTVNVKKPENIAKSINEILKNKNLLKRYSIAGYQHVKKNFMINIISIRYLKLFKKILKTVKAKKMGYKTK